MNHSLPPLYGDYLKFMSWLRTSSFATVVAVAGGLLRVRRKVLAAKFGEFRVQGLRIEEFEAWHPQIPSSQP